MLHKPKKIFLVDDDPFCLNLMKHVMITNGFADVHTYEGGAACLNFLTDEPDIIFLDQVMGSVSGIETLKAVKRFNPDIYVVFVSGQHEVAVAVESLKYGAFDYIVKDEKLSTKVSSVLTKIKDMGELLAQKPTSVPKRLRSFFGSVSLGLLLVPMMLLSC
ncbi:response regulator [Hymenobacter glaciei]|uniref:Response regulator n=1 Tax=Hymenobacter glaciei TaxID=877209 RepID=A0ABP7U6Y7_9BACT